MRYASVCDGIGAAHVAWLPLGWSCAWHAEIDPFPAAVVAHRLGNRAGPNLGDITTISQEQTDALGPIDLLVGGTPCQSFSVAGLRRGMADSRGNLALVFLRLAARTRARWIVWENVPGVLSSHGGRDFGAFLGALGELGYGWSYRVLDAQYVRVEPHARAVPQQRRRVFVVGHLGDWRPPSAVLLERAGVQGHPEPRREAGQVPPVAAPLGAKSGGGYRQDLDHETYVARCVTSGEAKRFDYETCTIIPQAVGFYGYDRNPGDCVHAEVSPAVKVANETHVAQAVATTLSAGSNPNSNAAGRRREDDVNIVAHCLRSSGSDASEDGTGRDTPLVVAYMPTRTLEPDGSITERFPERDRCDALTSCSGTGSNKSPIIAQAVNLRGRDGGSAPEVSDVASVRSATGGASRSFVANRWSVRRLTPRECERLQAFPDDWTLIPWRKGFAKDAPRYKAIGNSMATNVMSWIGRRIDAVERSP